jgi:hypothetical protein
MEQNQSQIANENASNEQSSNAQPINWRANIPTQPSSSKTLIKGVITGSLILLMLIPTVICK